MAKETKTGNTPPGEDLSQDLINAANQQKGFAGNDEGTTKTPEEIEKEEAENKRLDEEKADADAKIQKEQEDADAIQKQKDADAAAELEMQKKANEEERLVKEEAENKLAKEQAEQAAKFPVFPKDDPFKAKETHEKRLAKYGQDYVVAVKENMQTAFSKTSWDQISKNTQWKRAEPIPPEVLQNYLNKAK